MAKVITQETFDDVVQENIVDFSMSVAESRVETIQQFEAQGINLSNIIKDLSINEETGVPLVKEAIAQLKAHCSGAAVLDAAVLGTCVDVLRVECDKSVPHRVLAAKHGAQEVLVALADTEINKGEAVEQEMLKKIISAQNALINKQPDIFEPDTLVLAIEIFQSQRDPTILRLALSVLARACIMHEINRQNIMNSKTYVYLKPLVTHEDPEVIRALCTAVRYLILDDDVRVEFSKSPNHAQTLATEMMHELTDLIPKFKDLPLVQAELLVTVASLVVRNEYCVLVEEYGGLMHVLEAIRTHSANIKVVRESFQFLKALAGNDVVKAKIIEQGAAPLIADVLCIHKDSEPVAKLGLMCIATLTLRSTDNSLALFAANIAEEIVESMRLHPTSKAVQRNGSWAIRNMVSRSRHLCATFVELGAESVLNDAMVAHPAVLHDLKSALRDLGCKVDLKEEWTGTSTTKMAN